MDKSASSSILLASSLSISHTRNVVNWTQTISACKPALVLLAVLSILCYSTFYFSTIHNGHSKLFPSNNDLDKIIFNQSTVEAEDRQHFDKTKHHHLMEIEEEGNQFDRINSSSLQLNITGDKQMSLIQHRRVKRGVLDLASMINCITGCNPLSYKDYGCYCGFQGDGYPVDGIDRCCLMHDLCYERTSCHQALVYFKPYKWVCQGYGRARCAYVYGGSSKSLCGEQLCECDRKFAKCLSRYRCPRSKPDCNISKHIIIGK